MIRVDLVRRLAGHLGITLGEADGIVTAFTGAIIRGVRTSGRVVIQDFGSFTRRPAPAKVMRDPNNGGPLHVPAKKKLHFRPGKELREVVNNGGL